MSELNDTQWKQITKKYGKLMWMISHRVGGDTITNSVEDSYQEQSMSAMDAVRTFSNKTINPYEDESPYPLRISQITRAWEKIDNVGKHNYLSIQTNPRYKEIMKGN